MVGGDDKGDAVIDCVLFAAVSIIGLFDVNGTPDGLQGCMPAEIYNSSNHKEKEKRTKAIKIKKIPIYNLQFKFSTKSIRNSNLFPKTSHKS